MLMSHSHRFIFIHVYKVAGTSLRAALEPYAADRWRRLWARHLGRLYTPELPHPHLRAAQVLDLVGPEVFNNRFKFCFVRNPWAWQAKEHYQQQLARSFDNFDAYLKWRVNEDLHLQSEFILDAENRLLVDHVGRIETLNDDMRVITSRIGIPGLNVPVVDRSAHKDYRSYYSDYGRKLVEEAFAPDIERFGYNFDGISGPMQLPPRAFGVENTTPVTPGTLRQAIAQG